NEDVAGALLLRRQRAEVLTLDVELLAVDEDAPRGGVGARAHLLSLVGPAVALLALQPPVDVVPLVLLRPGVVMVVGEGEGVAAEVEDVLAAPRRLAYLSRKVGELPGLFGHEGHGAANAPFSMGRRSAPVECERRRGGLRRAGTAGSACRSTCGRETDDSGDRRALRLGQPALPAAPARGWRPPGPFSFVGGRSAGCLVLRRSMAARRLRRIDEL